MADLLKDTVLFLTEYKRMCNAISGEDGLYGCCECGLYDTEEGECGYEHGKFDNCFGEAVAIVQKWSDEHTQKTYAMDFIEKFPNCARTGNVPFICKSTVYGTKKCDALWNNCEKCWNEVMPENPDG